MLEKRHQRLFRQEQEKKKKKAKGKDMADYEMGDPETDKDQVRYRLCDSSKS